MAAARPSLIPALFYRDPAAASAWLQKAFDFEIDMLIEDAEGAAVHIELRYGESVVMVGVEWTDDHKSPASIGGKCTQTVHVHVPADIDAHCARAEAAGAEILMRPETQFYGDRTYRARDLEGHMWTFGQTVEAVAPADWDKAMGFKTYVRDA
ncbi:MAG: VOC family protein [Alphaproteobacteria bacterium]|nr:VOC family protein [Alphaproteobacteria bacterium]